MDAFKMRRRRLMSEKMMQRIMRLQTAVTPKESLSLSPKLPLRVDTGSLRVEKEESIRGTQKISRS